MLRASATSRLVVAAAAALLVVASPVHANTLHPVTDTVSVATTPAGPQLVLTGSSGDDDLIIEPSAPSAPEPRIFIGGENNDIIFVLDPSAKSRCTLSAYGDELAEPSCATAGLLTPTATIKPFRVDLGAGDDEFRGQSSPLPMEENGGDGNDNLFGSEFNDIIDGGPGNDSLSSNGGADVLRGGDGNDSIGAYFTEGAVLDGGAGDDDLHSNMGGDTYIGGPGDDALEEEEYLPFSQTLAPDPTPPTQDPDQPASCGDGDDTIVHYDDVNQPLAADASCETDIREPSLAPPQVHGTDAVGSTLTATRPVLGSSPHTRIYAWWTCDAPNEGIGGGCQYRSICQTFTLGSEDLGKLVFLQTREVFFGGGGRYEIRPDDQVVSVTPRVGPSGPAGVTPGPQVAGVPTRSLGTWSGWATGKDGSAAPHTYDFTAQPIYNGVAADTSNLQSKCPSLDLNGNPTAVASTPTPSPTPTPTPVATPTPSPTPTPATPTPTPAATPTPSPTPTPAATPTPSATPTPTPTPVLVDLPVIGQQASIAFAYIGGFAVIQGSGFSDLRAVTVGSRQAGILLGLPNLLIATLPAQAPGRYALSVTSSHGTGAGSPVVYATLW